MASRCSVGRVYTGRGHGIGRHLRAEVARVETDRWWIREGKGHRATGPTDGHRDAWTSHTQATLRQTVLVIERLRLTTRTGRSPTGAAHTSRRSAIGSASARLPHGSSGGPVELGTVLPAHPGRRPRVLLTKARREGTILRTKKVKG
jgi:hypothetical protein